MFGCVLTRNKKMPKGLSYCNGICIKRLELKLPSVMFWHFKSSMFQDNTPNELYHLDGPWDVKLPAFEFVLFLTLERTRLLVLF